MTDEINPSELGAFTNNLSNKEGIKKLCEMVNSGTESEGYTKEETDALLDEKQDVLTAGFGISIIEDVISASDEWEIVSEAADYKLLFDSETQSITRDCFMIFTDYKRYNGILYFPKGTLLTTNVKMPLISMSYTYYDDAFCLIDFNYVQLFSTGYSINGSRKTTKLTDKTGYYELAIFEGNNNNITYNKRLSETATLGTSVTAYRRKERE